MTSVAVLAAVAGVYLLSRQRQEASLNPARELIFSDITLAAGIEFRHEAGARGKMFNPETFGPGAGWFDHDGDDLGGPEDAGFYCSGTNTFSSTALVTNTTDFDDSCSCMDNTEGICYDFCGSCGSENPDPGTGSPTIVLPLVESFCNGDIGNLAAVIGIRGP